MTEQFPSFSPLVLCTVSTVTALLSNISQGYGNICGGMVVSFGETGEGSSSVWWLGKWISTAGLAAHDIRAEPKLVQNSAKH